MEIGRGNGSKRAEGFVTREEEAQKKYPELDVHEKEFPNSMYNVSLVFMHRLLLMVLLGTS